MKSQTVTSSLAIPPERIERRILWIRGQRVMLDADLAGLYGVKTKVFNQAVRRNINRFPDDFMFQLTDQESEVLRSQFVTPKGGRGGRRYRPLAFTEQGVAMLSSVLRLNEMERKYDAQFKVVFDAIREMMTPPAKPQRRIGFASHNEQ